MTLQSHLKLALCSFVFLCAGECAIAQSGLSPETAKIDSIITLETDADFQQLDGDHQRIARAIYEHVNPKITGKNNNFIDLVKFSIYGAEKVVADLKKQNTENIKNREQSKILLMELLEELRGQGIEPEAETQADPFKLLNWLVQNDKGLLAKFPMPLRSAWREKAKNSNYLSRGDTTVDMLLAPSIGGRDRRLTDPPVLQKTSSLLLDHNLIARSFDRAKAYDYGYRESEFALGIPQPEAYRKYFADRFVELASEDAGWASAFMTRTKTTIFREALKKGLVKQ